MHSLGVFSSCFSNWDSAALGSLVTLHTLTQSPDLCLGPGAPLPQKGYALR